MHRDAGVHTGTFLDTPFHRCGDGHDLAGLDPARVLDVPGVLVDATGAREAGPELLDGLDLGGTAVLLHTGWDVHWGTDRYGEAGHPYVAAAAAERLVGAGVSVVGIDSVNIDDTRTGERPFTFTALPPAVVGMGTFPVRAVAGLC